MAKRSPLEGYRTYDPRVEGYGSAREWRAEFNATMGLDEARRRVGHRTPYHILGIGVDASQVAIKAAFRRMSMEFHPDRAVINRMTVDEATERFKEIVAAYTVLSSAGARRGGGR